MWVVLADGSSVSGPDAIDSDSGREIVARACGPEFKLDLDAIEIDRVSVAGDTLSGVLRIADDVDAHLIAAPNLGSPGAIRAFLPNLGEPLLLNARCSVLIVPDDPRAATTFDSPGS